MRVGKCYVCGLSPTSVKAQRVIIGPNVWRHVDCHVGSQKWIDSTASKKSEFLELFKQINMKRRII